MESPLKFQFIQMIVLNISTRKDSAEIEIRLPKTTTPTKGLWLLEASRLIWEIWPRMGWNTVTGNRIYPEDWKKPLSNESKDSVMAMIERLLKIMETSFPEKGCNFEAVIESIATIADEIKEADLELVSCVETEDFRGMVIKTLLIGVLRGLNTKVAEEMDYFSDPIHKKFIYDKTYVRTFEDFVFYEAKGSFVGTYRVESSCDFPSYSVHLDEKEF